MPSTVKILAALLLLPACAPLPVDEGEEEVMTSTTTGEGSSSSSGEQDDTSSGSSTSTSEIEGASSTSTGEDSSSSSSPSTGGWSTTSDTSTGEGSSSSTGDPGMVCGDGLEDLYENCDDGNDVPGDGCSADCKRWDWNGIAKDVNEADLIQWVPCWSSSYSEHALVGEILEACTAGEIAIGCRAKGSSTFTVLAHADRSAILTGIPEIGETWTVINGSAWQWSHDQIAVFSFAKPWQGKDCNGALCWPRIGDTIIPWGRCGDQEMGLESAPLWERVVLQSFF